MAFSTRIPRPSFARTGDTTLVAGVALFSHEPAQLTRFYEHVLQTAFTHRVHDDGREHWIVAMGGIQVEVKALETANGAPTADAHDSGQSFGMGRAELSFRVADVPVAVARALEADGRVLQPVEQFGWGTFAVVADPDGNRLGLFAPPKTDSNSDTEDQA